MKFDYEFRSSDNVLHKGSINAVSREAAFIALKAQGVRPARLSETPGFWNAVVGKGKRWMLIFALSLTVMWLALISWHRTSASYRSSLPRHQIYGDPALLAELERGNFSSVFVSEANRYLAWFSQPGVLHKFESEGWRDEMALALREGGSEDIVASTEDSREVSELKRIVRGMQEELQRYLRIGYGTPESYVRRLEERQVREARIYNQAVRELNGEKNPEVWESRNASLRALGIRTVPVPIENL